MDITLKYISFYIVKTFNLELNIIHKRLHSSFCKIKNLKSMSLGSCFEFGDFGRAAPSTIEQLWDISGVGGKKRGCTKMHESERVSSKSNRSGSAGVRDGAEPRPVTRSDREWTCVARVAFPALFVRQDVPLSHLLFSRCFARCIA